MQVNLLKSIVASIAGSQATGIVDLLYGKKNVNEFLIAKKLKLTINQTRNILYRLADEGLVSFVRKKDSKKGGWYTYFWTLNSGKSLLKFRDNLIKMIEQLRQQLSQRKSARFFYCKNCNIESTEEAALSNQYTCSECGDVLELKEMQTEIAQYEKEIARLQETLAKVNDEVKVIGHKENKARERRLKAEQRKKIRERASRRAQTARVHSAPKVIKSSKSRGRKK